MKDNFFKILEKDSVLEIFNFKDTNAWVSIKYLMSLKLLDKNIRTDNVKKNEVLTLRGIKIIYCSIVHYIKHVLSKNEKDLFLGASTGLFTYNNKVKDSFFPYYDNETKNVIYMLNLGNISSFMKYEDYFLKENIVIENYLIAPLKKILVIFLKFYKKEKNFTKFISILENLDYLHITEKEIQTKYLEFQAGYILYRQFFKLLKIKRAFVVSAYSKSDIIAALKSLCVPVIEIQHGIIGSKHPGYNYQVENLNIPTPNIVYVYSQFWKDDLLSGMYYKNKQIRIVGKLKYDLTLDKSPEQNTYIVFTGQAIFTEKLFSFFNEANEILCRNKILLYYLPHPKETKQELIYLNEQIKGSSNILIYNGSSIAEDLIKFSIVHISIYSACHFDAIHFLGKTYILDIIENNYIDSYFNKFPDKFIKINRVSEIITKEFITKRLLHV